MKRDFLTIFDRTANLEGTLDGDPNIGKGWPSWKRGQQVRDRIMALKKENPAVTIEEIANHTGLSQCQAARHKTNLIAAGIWSISLIIALSGGYWLGANREEVEEWVTAQIEAVTEIIESNS